MTSRSNGWGNEYRIKKLAQYVRGWVNYFKLAEMKWILRQIDSWMRHRIRAIYWKQWKKSKTKFAQLKRMGVEEDMAWSLAGCRKGIWFCSKMHTVQMAFDNKKIAALGYLMFSDYYMKVREN